jgi:hypothetical protein
MGSRFDDLIFWTPLLQLHLITTATTLNSWITNLSLYFLWFSRILLLSATHGFSAMTARKRPLLSPINLRHGPRTEITASVGFTT